MQIHFKGSERVVKLTQVERRRLEEARTIAQNLGHIFDTAKGTADSITKLIDQLDGKTEQQKSLALGD